MRTKFFMMCLSVFVCISPAFALEPVVSEELPAQLNVKPQAVQSPHDIAAESATVCDAQVAQAAVSKQSHVQTAPAQAEYKAGVDAYGRAVTPADVGGANAVTLPDRIAFPVTIDVARYMGIQLPTGLEMQGRLGEITVLRGGQVLYNGREITDKINTFCQQPTPTKDQPHDTSAKTK